MRDSKKCNEKAQRGVAKGSQGRNKRQRWRATKEGTQTVAKESKGGRQRALMNLKVSMKLTLGRAKLS